MDCERHAVVAEREGFEPPEPRGSTVFKTAAIDHSATSPHTAHKAIIGLLASCCLQMFGRADMRAKKTGRNHVIPARNREQSGVSRRWRRHR